MSLRLPLLSTVVALALFSMANAAEFEVTQQKDGLTVLHDGKLLTRYLIKSGSKPILWPVMGPNGNPITRGYPMQDASEGEKADHPHHRSFWFTHGEVNDTDFWAEGNSKCGQIVHQKFEKVTGGKQATIVSINNWVDKDNKTICQDKRTLVFGVDQGNRYIDFTVTVNAVDEPVEFRDTKEGSFGMRIAGTMKVESDKGGTIINNHGQTNKDAWGQQASWVDYYGPVKGKTVGIAIFNHPSSFRYPSYWHVRTYGLFAANVFGLHHFKGDDTQDGSHLLKQGEPMTFRYRVLFHQGDNKEAKVAESFQRYAKTSP
ncbi:MAG: hypothetical protein COA78_07360 [Blastopirellula sp.]|nr:MAG: hypothetical protein COA78_07360 [Blastopirellula sp.]